MVAKGQMAGAESAPRTPLVAEEMAAVVSMAGGVGGRRRSGQKVERGQEIRSRPGLLIPCREIELGGNWPHLNRRGRLLLYRAGWPCFTRQG